MEKSYLKLYAKKRMVKNYFRCFAVSIFPYVTIFSLAVLNYYLFILLRQTDFNFSAYISPYAEFIRMFLVTVCLVLSFCIWKSICLFKDNFFLLKALKNKVLFFKSLKYVSFSQCVTFSFVSIIRFFLTVSWCTVYFLPCLAVSLLLLYSYRNENYGYNVNLTLFVASTLLFIVGISFLYVTLKRYSMCSYVLLTEKEKNPLRVIARSINLMEGYTICYAFYCLSFVGWILSCLLVAPTVYVIPYLNVGKWCFLNSLDSQRFLKQESEKPIIFYITPKIKKVGN